MKPKCFLVAGLAFSMVPLFAGEKSKPSAAARVDWENVRAAPAVVEVLNMSPVPLAADADSKQKFSWLRVPQRLQKGWHIFKPEGETNGITDFNVTRSGFVLVACNYAYQGNSGGDWGKDAWTAEDFLEHGWVEASEAELGGLLISGRNREHRIFAKYVEAGEAGRLRCNKYDPPFFIVAVSQKSEPQDGR